MKIIPLILSAVMLLQLTARATTDVVVAMVTVPIYHAWEDAPVRYVQLPHAGWDLTPMLCSHLYAKPYGKIEGSQAVTAKDMNLISLYQIKVEGQVNKQNKEIITFQIDTSAAVKPEGYKFTIAQVAAMAAKSISLDYPDRKRSPIQIDGKAAQLPADGK